MIHNNNLSMILYYYNITMIHNNNLSMILYYYNITMIHNNNLSMILYYYNITMIHNNNLRTIIIIITFIHPKILDQNVIQYDNKKRKPSKELILS